MDKYLQFFLDLFSNIGSIPYKIVKVPETKDYVIIQSKTISYYIWVFAVLSGGTHTLKSTVSLGWMAEGYWKSGEITKLVFHSVYVAAHCLMFTFQVACIVHQRDILNLINGTVAVCRKLEAALEPNMYIRPRIIRSMILLLFCINMISATILCSIPSFILFRDEVWHYGSTIYWIIKQLNFKHSEYIAIAFGIALDNWHLWACWGASVLHINALLLVVQTFMTSLQSIKRCTQKQQRRGNGYLRLHLTVYPKLRMIVLLLNNSYSNCYYPQLKSGLGIMTISGMYVAVGLSHLNNFMLTAFGIGVLFCCSTSLVIITTFTGIVHQESVKYIQYLQRNKLMDKMTQKVLKSIRIESIKCGRFYAITKLTSLTLLGMILSISGSLLISLKK